MVYRELGKTNLKISLLSFGGMRIPRVSVKAATEVINRAYNLGINYFETSSGYGDSEHKIGIALKKLDRSKVYISTKSHPGSDKTPFELRKRLDGSLKKLQLNHVDFYQMWGVNTEEHFDTIFKKGGTLEAVRKVQKEGLIHHLGFTTHADPSLILKIMETGEFESVTIIYHIFNRKNKDILDMAEKLNMGVAIITPLSQGMLAHPTPKMQEEFAPYDARDYSLKWLADDHRITTIVSGMKTIKELETNYHSLNTFSPFDEKQKEIGINLFSKLKTRVGKEYCTECKDCLPCPKEINIPEILRLNNLMVAYEAEYYCKSRYKSVGNLGSWYPGVKANHCNDCGECEPRCPERLPIVSILHRIHDQLYTGEQGPIASH